MIILDTNVVSEAFKPHPEPNVAAWMLTQPTALLFTTTITQAELLVGLALLPDGKRKRSLADVIDICFTERMAHRPLVFDEDSAVQYALIFAHRQRIGRPVGELDAQIAAIARSHGFAVATRNEYDFEHCGIAVINPWHRQ